MTHHIVQFSRGEGEFRIARAFPNEPGSPRAARRFITNALQKSGWGERLIDAAALTVTELASNAIQHAHSAFSVSLSAGLRGVRLEVRDADPISPGRAPLNPMSEAGRGLCLLDGVAERWGVERLPTGKVVWVELGH